MLYRLCSGYEVQPYLHKPWFKQCIAMNDPNHSENYSPGTYFVPVALYNEYMERKDKQDDTFPPSIEPIVILKLNLISGEVIRNLSEIKSYLSDYTKYDVIDSVVDSRIITYDMNDLIGRKVQIGNETITVL